LAGRVGVIGPATGSLQGLVFKTLVSTVGERIGSSELVGSVVGFFRVSLLRNPGTLAVVSSLTLLWGAGISAPEFGVIIAAVTFAIAALLFPGREGDQLQ
jgi:hypothetical protein